MQELSDVVTRLIIFTLVFITCRLFTNKEEKEGIKDTLKKVIKDE